MPDMSQRRRKCSKAANTRHPPDSCPVLPWLLRARLRRLGSHGVLPPRAPHLSWASFGSSWSFPSQLRFQPFGSAKITKKSGTTFFHVHSFWFGFFGGFCC